MLLYVSAAISVVKGVYFALQYSQDFQWSPSVLFVQGVDPYKWYLTGNADSKIILSQEPNYLPLLYELLAPFALMPWIVAKAVWAFCNLTMAVTTAFILSRDSGFRGAVQAALIAVFLSASPLAHTLGNGQQSLMCLFALTLAWRGQARSAGGIGMAVGAVKYSIALPVGLWLLFQRRFSAMGVASLICLLALAVFVWVTGAGLSEALLEPLRVGASATHIGLADAMSFIRSLNLDPSRSSRMAYLVGLLTTSFGMALLWRARNRLDQGDLFALLCVLSLFAFFHNLYDYVLLLPLFCRAFRWGTWRRAIALGYIGFFWFVVQFVEPWLKSSAAIALMALGSATVFVLIVLLVGERAASAALPVIPSAARA